MFDKEKTDDQSFRKFEIKLLAASVVIGAFGTLISAGLGFYGIYLGTEAINQTDRLERLKMRPLLVNTYRTFSSEKWGLETTNIGYGPAKIKSVTIGYLDDSGMSSWLRYSESEKISRVNLHEFLGIVGVNQHTETLSGQMKVDATLLTNWPWIGAYYGPGESFSLITIPADQFFSQEWRSTYGALLMQRLKSLCLGIEYESIAGEVFSSLNDSQRCSELDFSSKNRFN